MSELSHTAPRPGENARGESRKGQVSSHSTPTAEQSGHELGVQTGGELVRKEKAKHAGYGQVKQENLDISRLRAISEEQALGLGQPYMASETVSEEF